MKNLLKALLPLLLVVALVVLFIVQTSASRKRNETNLALVRADARIEQLLDGLTLEPEFAGYDTYCYTISLPLDEVDFTCPAQEPFIILKLGVDEAERPFVEEVTANSGSTTRALTEADLAAVKTICLWLPGRTETQSYSKNGKYYGQGQRETCHAYLYDLESGRFVATAGEWIKADELPETSGSTPHNRITEEHLLKFVRGKMRKDG